MIARNRIVPAIGIAVAAAVALGALVRKVDAQVGGTLSEYTVLTSIGDIIFNKLTISNIIGPQVQRIPITDGKTDTGVAMAVETSQGAGTMGVARTTGTSLQLDGNVTSSNAKTDKVMWEIALPITYKAGTAIPVTIDQNYTGSGTVTGASTTITVAAYTESNGVETAITGITAAQPMTATPTDLIFTIPASAALISGQRIVIEIVMLVTSASGGNEGQINKIEFSA